MSILFEGGEWKPKPPKNICGKNKVMFLIVLCLVLFTEVIGSSPSEHLSFFGYEWPLPNRIVRCIHEPLPGININHEIGGPLPEFFSCIDEPLQAINKRPLPNLKLKSCFHEPLQVFNSPSACRAFSYPDRAFSKQIGRAHV